MAHVKKKELTATDNVIWQSQNLEAMTLGLACRQVASAASCSPRNASRSRTSSSPVNSTTAVIADSERGLGNISGAPCIESA